MRKFQKIALILFVVGGAIILGGLLMEALQVMHSAWPSILLGLGIIGAALILDGYEGSRFH